MVAEAKSQSTAAAYRYLLSLLSSQARSISRTNPTKNACRVYTSAMTAVIQK